MTFFATDHLRATLNANWLRPPRRDTELEGVGIDSRDDLNGKAFIAIKGATHDGHQFLDAAVKSGAGLLIVESENASLSSNWPEHVGVLHVESTREALSKLALAYRRTLRGTKVIAITGSAGKTTTKRLVHAVLSTTMAGSASPKSFNNDIGLPLTILQAKLSDKFLVVEIGTNAPGEIAQLAAIAEPDLAVITSIGRAHLQGLGSVEGIAAEKASLLNHLQANGAAIVNADAPLLRPHLKRVTTRILFGEAEDADLRLTARGSMPSFWFEINGRQRFGLAMPGKHNAMNALAAVAVGRRLGMDDDAIALGLRSVEPAAMRLAAQNIGDITIFNDAYNANPDSMIAALDTFNELAEGATRRIIILGDMLELGETAPELHRELGRHICAIDSKMAIAQALFIGELSGFAAAEIARRWSNDRIIRFNTLDDAAKETIASLIRPGDAILMKASRGMELERLIPALQGRFGASRSSSTSTAFTAKA